MKLLGFAIALALLLAATARGQGRPVADWTVLVYMSADNDLERPGMKNLKEMARVGSTERMNLVVQIDRSDRDHLLQKNILARLLAGGNDQISEWLRQLLDRLDDQGDGDWTGARRFHVERGRTAAAMDLGEVDMGDPATLESFLKWALSEYPARRYFLVLWGHGSGIAPFERLIDQVMTNFGQYAGILHGTRTVALDNTSDDQLEIEEVVQVLESAGIRGRLASGRASERVDILGFDACLMGQLEVMHALRETADLFVASESLVPVAGWAYEETFGWLARELAAGRSVEPQALARRLVDRTIPLPTIFDTVGKAVAGLFIKLFGGQPPERQITLAAITAGAERELESTVDALAGELTAQLASERPQGFLRAVAAAKDEAQTFLFEQFIDLFHFGELLGKKVVDQGLAERLARGLDPARSVVLHRHEGDLNARSRGVSIFFPVVDYSILVPDDWYDRTAFARANKWRDFVRAFLKSFRTYRLGINVDRMVEKIDGEWDEDALDRSKSDASIKFLAEAVDGDLFVAAVADKPWKAAALLTPLLPYRERVKEKYPAVQGLLAEVEGQLSELAAQYQGSGASAEKLSEVANLRAQARSLVDDAALAPAAVLTHPALDHVVFGTFSQKDTGDFVRRYRTVSKSPWNWDENRYRKAVLKTVQYWDSVLGGLEDRTDAASVATRTELTRRRAELSLLLPRKDDPDEYWHYPAAAQYLLDLWTEHKRDNRLERLLRSRDPAAAAAAAVPPPLPPLSDAGGAAAPGEAAGTSGGPAGALVSPAPAPSARSRSRDPMDADGELTGR